jgi:hypothetical protein
MSINIIHSQALGNVGGGPFGISVGPTVGALVG